jgi:hypothetical protein
MKSAFIQLFSAITAKALLVAEPLPEITEKSLYMSAVIRECLLCQSFI